jgi:galactose mutarotase-like enzyme
MNFSHREDNREGRRLDVLTDETTGVRIAVSRLGAELISFCRRNFAGEWVGFLYRDNDLTAPLQGWGNHATVMGYYLHRLKAGRSLYRGHEISGGTHGFLRTVVWHPVHAANGEGALIYRVGPEDYQPHDYPLKVSLELEYRLAGGALSVNFRFTNHEPELTAHVGFGLHPGFGATSFESFQFEMPAGKYRRHLAPNNFLSGETRDIQFEGGLMPFPRETLPGSYIIELVDVPNRIFVYRDPPSGRIVSLELPDVPYLTLWSDGGPFLCVEPCWGLTDRHDQRPFEEKEGIQKIAPGGELRATFGIRPEFAGKA